MTKEKAISYLGMAVPIMALTVERFAEFDEAMRMAAQALEEQQWIPCSETDDLPDHEVLCCDRYGEELIGWLLYSDDQWLCESDGATMYDPIAWCEKPELQWIPCSITTNLPDHEVLCCDLRGEMLIGYLCTDEGSDTGFLAESDGECLVDCVAWREKPEPWHER